MNWLTQWCAVVLACLAVLGLLDRPAGARRLDPPGAEPSTAVRSLRRWPLLIGLGLAAVLVALLLGGPRGAVLTAALVILSASIYGQTYAHRVHQRRLRLRAEVARACVALAAQLRVGRVPDDALRLCADDHPILARGARALSLGADPVGVWVAQGREPGQEGLRHLAHGWAVAVRTGAPLAVILERVAEGVEQEQGLHQLVAGEVASPRTTGKIMAAVPLVGLALGFAMGGNPLRFLLEQPVGWACLLLGLALAASGVAWIEALARRAELR
jgi:tight adherence protein B